VEQSVLNLHEVRVRPVERSEEPLHRRLMATHHYLGYLPKIGQTLWYVASYHEQWVALLDFSAAAWKCAVRDRWVGWDFHHQYDYDRLKLIANNSRFVILPDWHYPNLGSKILSLCHRRLASDWQERFGHRLLLLETFVDPRFHGTVYRAANWLYLGLTRGYSRTRQGYSNTVHSPKKVFVKSLQSDARAVLSQPLLTFPYRQGVPKIMLSAQQMRSLPDFFTDIADPRRAQGRRHPLPTVLAIAAGAILCGMRGYKAIADWAQSLGPKARERLRCRRVNGHYGVPSESIIRDVMIRVDPTHLDRALKRWNQAYGQQDTTLAIDGKTMCNALDPNGHQTHVMSVVGHHSKICYTQKKLAACHARDRP
jgi:uncharacterized protein DUF4338/DDE family transposase